jgi:hypothetical protein
MVSRKYPMRNRSHKCPNLVMRIQLTTTVRKMTVQNYCLVFCCYKLLLRMSKLLTIFKSSKSKAEVTD